MQKRIETDYVQGQNDCAFCNKSKGPNVAGYDPQTRKLVPLFNPRTQKWDRHFQWDGALLQARSQIGRATIVVLDMNRADAIALRRQLIDEGVFPMERSQP